MMAMADPGSEELVQIPIPNPIPVAEAQESKRAADTNLWKMLALNKGPFAGEIPHMVCTRKIDGGQIGLEYIPTKDGIDLNRVFTHNGFIIIDNKNNVRMAEFLGVGMKEHIIDGTIGCECQALAERIHLRHPDVYKIKIYGELVFRDAGQTVKKGKDNGVYDAEYFNKLFVFQGNAEFIDCPDVQYRPASNNMDMFKGVTTPAWVYEGPYSIAGMTKICTNMVTHVHKHEGVVLHIQNPDGTSSLGTKLRTGHTEPGQQHEVFFQRGFDLDIYKIEIREIIKVLKTMFLKTAPEHKIERLEGKAMSKSRQNKRTKKYNPINNAIYSILRKMKTHGTFEEVRPLQELVQEFVKLAIKDKAVVLFGEENENLAPNIQKQIEGMLAHPERIDL
jgi:hypothetical protein